METSLPHTVPSPQGATMPNDVIEWRRRKLLASGFDSLLADRAARARIDLHEVLALIDRGCPPHLALRILRPLDAPEPSVGPSVLSPVSPWPPGSTVKPEPRGS